MLQTLPLDITPDHLVVDLAQNSMTMHHQEQNARSLALHTAAIELMRADETLIERALDLLARWDTHVSAHSKPLRDEWVRILQERDWALALSVSERGNQLRQASPVSCMLPTERRLEILRATAHPDSRHLLSSENIVRASAIALSA